MIASLLADVRDAAGFAPRAAVISTPALFELPQNHATARAGRLAGLEEVVLIQEPIASAIAAGWRADQGTTRRDLAGVRPGRRDAGRLVARDRRRAACACSITRATTSWAARTSTARWCEWAAAALARRGAALRARSRDRARPPGPGAAAGRLRAGEDRAVARRAHDDRRSRSRPPATATAATIGSSRSRATSWRR